MGQMGFFDIANRYAGLDAKNDPLARIDEAVPWAALRPRLETVWRRATFRQRCLLFARLLPLYPQLRTLSSAKNSVVLAPSHMAPRSQICAPQAAWNS